MRITILVLLGGLGLLLIGVGLLGTLLGIRATLNGFATLEIGLIMGGYYAGYLLGTQFGPVVISRVGHVRAFAAFAAITAASVLSFGLWVTPGAWFVLRVISGASAVGVYMVVESWLNAQTPTALRGRVFAAYMITTLVALAIGQYLLLAYPPTGLELFALATILITLGLVPIAVVRVREPGIHELAPLHLVQLYRQSPLGAIGALVSGVVNSLFWTMTPVFAQQLSMSTAEIAVLMSATIGGGALLQYPIGHLSDRYDRRSVLVIVSLVTAAISAAAGYTVMAGLAGLPVIAFCYGGLMFSLYSISVAHTNDHLDTTQTLSATQGLLFIYGVGALTGPLLGALAMDLAGAVGLPFLGSAVLLCLGLFGVLRMLRRAPPAPGQQGEFVPLLRTTPVVLEMHPESDVPGEDGRDP